MFTDMVGYTALGQKNESLSLALVEEQRKVIRPILARHNGREVKTIGDAFLVEFPSALDAVRCAYEIQRATKEFNITLPSEKRIHLRVGVHLGDVVESQGDISGDAVNVASRIEPLAEDGGVCLSRQVYDHVHNKLDLQLSSIGMRPLKNVSEPLEVYKVVMPWELAGVSSPPEYGKNRIAVLPFVNISPDPNDEYFADGLTEELITRVSLVKGLEVIARTSVMIYKKKEKNVAQIGEELKVGTLLEGSVRKADNRIRISAQLIDAGSEAHLWAENYDRDFRDIFSIQSEIAQNVATALKVHLLEGEKESIRRPSTTDPVAYDFYLKGLFHSRRATEEEYMTALGYLERAIERDPEFALAYAGMAKVYDFLGFFEIMPSKEAFDKSEKLAKRALELDDSLAEAHLAMARVLRMNWDFKGSLAEAKRALSLNPNLAEAHIALTMYYGFAWQFEEGLGAIRKALELDPFSPQTLQSAGTWFLYSGQPSRAAELYKKVLEADPDDSFARGNLGLCYVKQGLYDAGLAEIRKGIAMSKSFDPSRYSDLTYALAKAGKIEQARAVIPELIQYYEQHRAGAGAVAFAYGSVGDKERAFEWLEKAFDEHSGYLGSVSLDFAFEDLHSDPRFQSFLKRMGQGPPQI
jgi:adenylate cyclase